MRAEGLRKEIFRKREVVKMATLMMKKRSGVSVRFAMMVALVATCFVYQIHARNTIIEFLTVAAQLEGGNGNGKECCEACLCNLSNPPKCQCMDIGDTCYAGCDLCACTRSLHPQCRCLDIKPYCPHKCPTVAPYEAIVSSTHTDPTT